MLTDGTSFLNAFYEYLLCSYILRQIIMKFWEIYILNHTSVTPKLAMCILISSRFSAACPLVIIILYLLTHTQRHPHTHTHTPLNY